MRHRAAQMFAQGGLARAPTWPPKPTRNGPCSLTCGPPSVHGIARTPSPKVFKTPGPGRPPRCLAARSLWQTPIAPYLPAAPTRSALPKTPPPVNPPGIRVWLKFQHAQVFCAKFRAHVLRSFPRRAKLRKRRRVVRPLCLKPMPQLSS